MLRSGTLTIAAGSVQLSLSAGQIATVPAGTLRWSATDADCVLVALRADNPAVALAAINLAHHLVPGGAPNAALVDTPLPETMIHTFYQQGKLSLGVWTGTPYLRRVTPYGFSEIMWLSEGEMALTDATGDAALFKAGDICAACAGAEVSWENFSFMKKFYIIRAE